MSSLQDGLESLKIKWVIPKVCTIDTTEECNNLLHSGYTLINNMGYKVSYRDGEQFKTNWNRTRDYKFSKPSLWQVYNNTKSTNDKTVIVDIYSFGFKLHNILYELSNKFL